MMVDNADFADGVLQGLDDAPTVPFELRKEATAALLGPGPGGLLACSWLRRHGLLELTQLEEFIALLPPGAPRPDALGESRWSELQNEWIDLSLSSWPRLLASASLSARARAASLAALTRELPTASASRLAHWACRNDRNDPEWPEAPAELSRLGFLECVRLGEPPGQTLEEALARPADAGAGQAALELMERYNAEIPPHDLEVGLQKLRGSGTSSLRRRAYGLLERLQGERWIHEGLRDRDAGVRSWALQRLGGATKGLGGATKGDVCANSRST